MDQDWETGRNHLLLNDFRGPVFILGKDVDVWGGGIPRHPHQEQAEVEDQHQSCIQEGGEQAPFLKKAEILQHVQQNVEDFPVSLL